MSTRPLPLILGAVCAALLAWGVAWTMTAGFSRPSAFLLVVGVIGLPLAWILWVAGSHETFPDGSPDRPWGPSGPQDGPR